MTAAIDVTPEQRKTLLALLRCFIPGVAVWTYGSRVKWTARPNSDLDLIAFTTPAQRHLVSELKEALDESNLPFLVDFHVWDEVPERFHEIIRKEFVVLQEAKEPKDGLGVAEDWNRTSLGAIATNNGYGLVDGPFGSNLPASCYTVEGIPVIRGSNLTLGTSRFRAHEFVFVSPDTAKRLERSLCRPLDIVFTKKGTLGQTGLVPDDGPYDLYLLSSNQMKLTVDRLVADPLFAYYFVSSPESTQKIIRDSEATGVPKTNVAYLRDFPIILPPLTEQKNIAQILGKLDDKIELNRRMNATLEAMARALFQSWFVDFDPVRAKLDGREPAGLDAATAALFPGHFQESALGHIPQGWEVKSLGEVIELAYGKPLKAEDRKNGSICVYGSNGPIGWHDEKLVSGPGIVVGRKGNPGVVTWAHGDFYPIDTTFYVVPTGDCRSLYFFYYALSVHNLANLSADSAVPGLNRNHAYMSKQVIPQQPVLEAFDSLISPIFAAIYSNEQQSRTLAALRDTLLPKLLSGEVSAFSADKFLKIE